MTMCESCKYADISYGERVVQEGNVTLVQNGSVNISCKNSGMSISFDKDGEIVCSGYLAIH